MNNNLFHVKILLLFFLKTKNGFQLEIRFIFKICFSISWGNADLKRKIGFVRQFMSGMKNIRLSKYTII